MKQARNTKKALLSSVLSLVICVTMLIGTTFAWFTDSVTSANNIIKSGNLKVSLEYMDGTKEVADVESNEWKDASQEAIFDYSLWEPGYVSVRHIKIGNEGSLALKYMVAIEANGEVSKLADVIDVYYVDPAQKIADRTALTDANKLGTLTEVLGKLDSTAAGNLAAGSADRITIALKMQETAGNEYQNLSIGTDFSVKVFATQLAAENDSFGPDYDEDAYLPVVRSLAQLRNAIADGQSVRLGSDISVEEDDAENGNAIYYTGDESITIDLNGHTFTGNTSNVVFRFQKAAGGAENTITIKNGKIVAGEDDWSAVSIGSSADTKTYVKLENLEISSSKANDLAVRARAGAEITMTNCVVNATNGAGGIVAGGGNVTLNNVTVNQSGVYNWNSVALGISGGSTMTVNSGTFNSDPEGNAKGTWVVYIMSSGGNFVVNGGTFNGTVAETANASNACGIICADRAAVVKINGGTFNSNGAILDMRNNVGTQPNPVATLAGGTFSSDPRVSGLYSSNLIKVAEGHEAIENGDGTWTVSRDYIAVPTVGTDKKANGEALADVMNSATEASYLKLGAGEYSMPSIGGSKDITIVGSKETVIDVTMGAYLDGSKVTFEGVTIKGSTGMANGNGSDYAAMYTPDVTYINCTFDGAFRVGRDGATFINCTFNNLGDNYVWNMNNDTVFEGCTFNSDGKALLIYADGPSADQVASVVVKNCIFKSTKGAKAGAIANQNCAAIEMQNWGCSIDLTVEGNTYDSNFSGEWRIKSYENRGYSITVNGTNYNTIAIDGKTMTIDSNKNVTVNN